MLDLFLTFINQQKLDLSSRRTLLTISGGVDSIVMAHLFHSAGFPTGFAHCNFGLRGEESILDEMLVRDLATHYNSPVFVKHFDVKIFAKENSISTQMAARDLRYPWFEEVRQENSYDWIATAHHANDALETTLLNLVRGTGIAGLHGIASQNRFLIRPLLFATKEEILDYALKNELIWREDRSNASLDYKRNIVRKKIVPVLKEMNPSLENTFLITSERVRAADLLLSEFMEKWQENTVKTVAEKLYISIESLLLETQPVYRLWYILNRYGFGYTQVKLITKSLNSISGKVFYSDSHVLLKDREDLILKPIDKEESNTQVFISEPKGNFMFNDDCLNFSQEIKEPDFQVEKRKDKIYLDKQKLLFPLKIRQWLSGDSFCPFGMNGKRKKVSDILIDLKLNIYQKQKINVLVNGDEELIWVIGIRSDERFKITDETETIVKVEWLENFK